MDLLPKNHGKKDKNGIVDSKVDLSMKYFKDHSRKRSTGNNTTIKDIKSRYRSEFAYGSTNEKISEVIKAEREVKKDAETAIYIENSTLENGLVFIKEGTVIGRTFTNQEIFKMRNSNIDAREIMDKIKLNDDGVAVLKNQDKTLVVQGNYLRIMMRDRDGSLVENVEDYMKLDPRPSSRLFEAPVFEKIEASENQIYKMASAIEAETDSQEEYVAFAWLIRNRYEDPAFSNSLNTIIDSFDSTTPSELALNAARNVLNGEIVSPIADRCYYDERGTSVPAKSDPVQVPSEKGKIYHYDISNIKNHDYRNDINKYSKK